MIRSMAMLLFLLTGFANSSMAQTCHGAGPQTPRDIDQKAGENPSVFSIAPDYSAMNLCNIHFHKFAEHRAKDFSIPEAGAYGGFRCRTKKHLKRRELEPLANNFCTNVAPGDTVEVHWAYSSCAVKPGKGLGSCLSKACSNPALRVESQVFLVVNDRAALDFEKFAYRNNIVEGYHQAKSLPIGTGEPVQFLGSTTGSSFPEGTCSPFQVTWSVRPECAKLGIASLSGWCEQNVFEENYGHGARPLVTDLELLSKIE